MVEKTADELIEELGYKRITDENDSIITYCGCKDSTCYINFDLETREVCLSNKLCEAEPFITSELVAVYKKAKELGWID